MKKEVKQKWTAALRSGEYQQGRKVLRTAEGQFCCLGVLCDLYSKEIGTEWKFEEGEWKFLGKAGLLPVAVARWAGLTTYDPAVTYHDNNGEPKQYYLSALNDTGKEFPILSNIIEAQL